MSFGQSRLSGARNSLVPMRQPLAATQPRAALAPLAPTAPTGFTVFQDKENDAPPAKKARLSLSLKSSVPAAAPAPIVRVPLAPTSTELSNPDMRPGYLTQLTVGKNGEEMSFEEARASMPRYAYKKSAMRESLSSSAAAVAAVASQIALSRTPETTQSHALASPRHPSPTICTRSAMNDIDAMFKDSPLAVPFSTRSLTTEIPPGGGALDAALAELNNRGRPSPVAFTVFTDEELMTRNIQAAAEAQAAFAAKSYPPLTPILELSHESDMSHASNTSMGAPTPASRPNASQAAAAAAVAAQVQAPAPAPAAAPEEAAAENAVDPFDAPQRDQWISELDVLSSAGVTDCSSKSSGLDLNALASGRETEVAFGDHMFEVSAVLSASAASSPDQRIVCLRAINLLGSDEIELRLAPRTAVLEQYFSTACMTRALEAEGVGSARAAAEAQMKSLFYLTQESYVYSDLCISVSAVSPSGNLRSLLSAYAAAGTQMDERLVAFYCLELLKLVQFLHANQLLHNNLTIDTVWVRHEEDGTAWSDEWSSTGENGWAGKGVAIGNFTSCIDRALFPADAAFKCESHAYLAAANPMMAFTQESLGHSTWLESVDLVSVASIAYQLLFGAGDMECALDESGQVQLVRELTSEFACAALAPFFETVLNFRPTAAAPNESLELLAQLTQHFESALAMQIDGAVVGNTIKNMLVKQQQRMLRK